MSVKIYLYYGPYEAAGTVEYRQFRLQGLKSKFEPIAVVCPQEDKEHKTYLGSSANRKRATHTSIHFEQMS